MRKSASAFAALLVCIGFIACKSSYYYTPINQAELKPKVKSHQGAEILVSGTAERLEGDNWRLTLKLDGIAPDEIRDMSLRGESKPYPLSLAPSDGGSAITWEVPNGRYVRRWKFYLSLNLNDSDRSETIKFKPPSSVHLTPLGRTAAVVVGVGIYAAGYTIGYYVF